MGTKSRIVKNRGLTHLVAAATREGRRLAFLAAIWAAIGLALLHPLSSKAHDADYSVTNSTYYAYNVALKVGPNGTMLLKSSALTSNLP